MKTYQITFIDHLDFYWVFQVDAINRSSAMNKFLQCTTLFSQVISMKNIKNAYK